MKVASILKLCKVHKGEHYQNGTCFQLLPCTPLFFYCPWPIWYSQLLINLKMRIYHMYCVIYNYVTIIFSFSCIWVRWVWVSIKTLLVHSMKSPKGAALCVCVFSQDCRFHELCVKVMRKAPQWWWSFIFLLFPISLVIEN
jgi:hypothetical protein